MSWHSQVVNLAQCWVERSRQRRDLAALSDAALKDIGLTRDDVWQESSKPFWRL
ncbi:MAG: DUF1127 domain-containing protein [Geminicoccaceae bacterium]